MNPKKVLASFLVLVVVIAGVIYFYKKSNQTKLNLTIPEDTPSVSEQIKDKLPGLKVPTDEEKIELTNVSGGEAMGIATRTEIIADLPDPANGEYYQVYLGDGKENVFLGNLQPLKGGYVLEYDLTDYPNYSQIVVIKGAKRILEGTLN